MILDTNVLINLVLQDNINLSVKEKSILDKLTSLSLDCLYIPTYVITEFLVVMKKVIPKRFKIGIRTTQSLYIKSLNLVEKLVKYANIINPTIKEITDSLEKSNVFLKNTNKELSYTDILLIVTSKERNLEILSGDKLLNKYMET